MLGEWGNWIPPPEVLGAVRPNASSCCLGDAAELVSPSPAAPVPAAFVSPPCGFPKGPAPSPPAAPCQHCWIPPGPIWGKTPRKSPKWTGSGGKGDAEVLVAPRGMWGRRSGRAPAVAGEAGGVPAARGRHWGGRGRRTDIIWEARSRSHAHVRPFSRPAPPLGDFSLLSKPSPLGLRGTDGRTPACARAPQPSSSIPRRARVLSPKLGGLQLPLKNGETESRGVAGHV